MNEQDFDNYDLRKWLDKGLSRHPEPLKRKAAEKVSSSEWGRARFIVPIAALGSMLVMSGTASSATTNDNPPPFLPTMVQTQSGSLVNANADLVNWSVRLPPKSSSIAASFETKAREIINRIGSNTAVPAETRKLAAGLPTYEPTVAPNEVEPWIVELARNLSNFSD